MKSTRRSSLSVASILAVGTLALGLVGAVPCSAQSATGDVTESVDVRLVNVDVVVTDRKGRPVPGLTREDFKVFEDGQEVDVTNFFASDIGDSSKAQEIGGKRNSGNTAAAESEPLAVVVYFDERNLPPNHRQRVLTDLRTFLADSAFGGSEFVVASYGMSLKILAGPTKNRDEVLAALAVKPEASSQAMQDSVAMRTTLNTIRDAYEACDNVGGGNENLDDSAGGGGNGGIINRGGFCVPCDDVWPDMMNYARRYSEVEQARTADGISAMAEVIAVMGGLSGRKALLYVGDGYQQRAGYSIFSYLGDLCGGERPQAQNEVFRAVIDYDSTNRFDELAAFANASRTTIYMLDAAGVRAGQSVSVDFTSKKFAPTSQNDQLRIDNLQASHSFIAKETGGDAILNANRPLKALENLAGDLQGGAYSLGYVPPHGPTGLTHRLRVEMVKDVGRGVRVRHRRSYLDKRLDARLVDRLHSALYLDGVADQLKISASVLASQRPETLSDAGLALVPVEILIPSNSVLLVPEGDASSDETGQLRVWLGSTDERQDRGEMRQQLFDLGPGRLQPEDGRYRIVVNMLLEPGPRTIAVGVRDEVSSKESYARLAVEVAVP